MQKAATALDNGHPATGTPYGLKALKSELRSLVELGDGHRYPNLYQAALKLGSLVGSGNLNVGYAHDQLCRRGEELGGIQREVARIALAGLNKGIASPRGPSPDSQFYGRNDVAMRVAQVRETAEKHSWPGRKGLSDLCLLTALMLTSEKCGKVSFHASLRHLSELAGLSLAAVDKAASRLEGRWVVRESRGTRMSRTDPTLWRLLTPHPHSPADEHARSATNISGPTCPTAGLLLPHAGDDPRLLPGHDWWARRREAWRLMCLLRARALDGVPTCEAPEETGMCRSTFFAARAQLESLGLVATKAQSWHLVELQRLEPSHGLGIASPASARSARHKADRKAHDKWIAEIRTRSNLRRERMRRRAVQEVPPLNTDLATGQVLDHCNICRGRVTRVLFVDAVVCPECTPRLGEPSTFRTPKGGILSIVVADVRPDVTTRADESDDLGRTSIGRAA